LDDRYFSVRHQRSQPCLHDPRPPDHRTRSLLWRSGHLRASAEQLHAEPAARDVENPELQHTVEVPTDARDLTEPGKGSGTYRMLLDTGYDSGEQVLKGGIMQIHKE
jgi:hypothetical protein